MKIIKSIISNVYVKNLGLAAIILIVIVLLTLWALNVYTHHGEAVVVPDVKHLQVSEAATFFEKANLRYKVVDSTFVKNAKPGSIVEITPAAGSKVKANRIIFLVANSFSVETFAIPDVKDLSQRQAEALLKASGFENITIQRVNSPYKDLVVGLEYKGKEVKTGEKIQGSAQLVLLVSSGEGSDTPEGDSLNIQMQEEPVIDNSWF